MANSLKCALLILLLCSPAMAQSPSIYGSAVSLDGTLTPQAFGGHGDAVRIYAGCSVSASSTGLFCNNTSFVSADTGKQIWIPGAGASGASLHTTIASVTNSTTVTLASAASTAAVGAQAIYGHDDSTAIQNCMNYAGTNHVPCALNSKSGYLFSTGLVIPSHMMLSGNSHTQATNLFCEVNGDCFSLLPGPDTGVNISNFELWIDNTLSNSRGIHLNPSTGQGVPFGGLYNSNITNVQVENMAQECLWLDGGGGSGYTYNLPNQYVTFNQFNCNGPVQQHNANMILITGQNAQIIFINGATNTVPNNAANQAQFNLWQSYYPNAMISIHEKTVGLNDAPMDIKFYGYTYEVGTTGLYISQSTDIHYDNGYVEGVPNGLIVANSSGFTFNGNHLANVGSSQPGGGVTATAVAQFGVNSYGSFRDNAMLYSGSTPPLMATCTAPGYIDFEANAGLVTTTAGCATQQAVNSSTLTLNGVTAFLNGSSSPVTNIADTSVMPGKTLTLFAGTGPIVLSSGGNIDLGGYGSPLYIAQNGSVTLTLFDLGPAWLVTGATGLGSYSASGIALPACNASTPKGLDLKVSDATSPSFMSAYTSGGSITADAICSYNGSSYQWLTH
jgi:hypothetical protein